MHARFQMSLSFVIEEKIEKFSRNLAENESLEDENVQFEALKGAA
jgi:hypothetical protein